MKTKYNIYYLLLCLVALLFSCTAAEYEIGVSPGNTGGQAAEAQVVFSLSVPIHGLPSARTRGVAIENDSEIKDYVIWIFKGTGNDATFVSEIKSTDIGKVTIRDKQMFVLLPESDEEITLSLIVNAPSVATPEVNTPKAEALATVEYSIGTATNLTQMPMYGEQTIIVMQGAKKDIKLTRAMAKIEVDIRDAFDLFQLQSVEMLNINTEGNVYKGVKPSLLDSWAQEVNKESTKEGNIFTAYIPEILDINAQKGGKKVSVLLKGIYKKDNQVSYYRLEFITRGEEKVENISRNHKYAFIINNIGATGFDSRDAAIAGSASNSGGALGDFQTIKNEEIMDITTDGANYLGVTSSTIEAGMNDHYYFANFSIVTNNENGWEIKPEELPPGVTVSMYNYSSHTETEKVNSVWIYVNKKTTEITVKDVITVFIYSNSIRKKIEVIIIP